MAIPVLAWGWHGLTPTILSNKSDSTKINFFECRRRASKRSKKRCCHSNPEIHTTPKCWRGQIHSEAPILALSTFGNHCLLGEIDVWRLLLDSGVVSFCQKLASKCTTQITTQTLFLRGGIRKRIAYEGLRLKC